MKTYTANYNSYGTMLQNAITGTNKKQLLKDIIAITKGNTPAGNMACFWVSDQSDKEVYFGTLWQTGKITFEIYNYQYRY